MKIVILDGYTVNPGDLSWERLEDIAEVTVYDRTLPQDVEKRAKGADAILVNKVVIGRKEIDSLPDLKYVGVLATGYNIVDVAYAREKDIVVTNIPAYSTDSVAQMVFAHLLAVTNRVEHYSRLCREGKWSSSSDFCFWDTPLTELSGKTMGIVGLGNIGMKVATIARNFGMDVFAVTSKPSASLPEGIQKTTLEGLLAISDVLSLHCPLTPETMHVINADTIAMMRPHSIIINTGRGPLIDDDAVAEALSTGKLAAYCTDVMSEEPPSPECPLLRRDNAFITPHIAWATVEARKRLIDIATNNVEAFMAGTPANVVK